MATLAPREARSPGLSRGRTDGLDHATSASGRAMRSSEAIRRRPDLRAGSGAEAGARPRRASGGAAVTRASRGRLRSAGCNRGRRGRSRARAWRIRRRKGDVVSSLNSLIPGVRRAARTLRCLVLLIVAGAGCRHSDRRVSVRRGWHRRAEVAAPHGLECRSRRGLPVARVPRRIPRSDPGRALAPAVRDRCHVRGDDVRPSGPAHQLGRSVPRVPRCLREHLRAGDLARQPVLSRSSCRAGSLVLGQGPGAGLPVPVARLPGAVAPHGQLSDSCMLALKVVPVTT